MDGAPLPTSARTPRGIRGWLGNVDHEHGRLYGAAAEPFQGLLARLMRRAAAARVGTYLRA
jgi:hypothetical protein